MSKVMDEEFKRWTALGVKWLKQFENETGVIQSSPIVRGRFMFITLPSGRVMALNANDGSTLWVYDTKSAGTNRGVATLDDKIYVGTADAKLIALSAQTGALLWEKTIADKNMYLITSAPLVRRSLVVTGVATNGGGRGFIAALDAKAGEEKWRFTTIPGVGEKGNDTWGGDSWKEGGAPTWLTGSYDESADILYWGVGNPKPDYNAAARKGDNLYSNSVVALRGSSGKLLWHFQFTPADDHEWDSNQIPVLIDQAESKGGKKLLLFANRMGFFTS